MIRRIIGSDAKIYLACGPTDFRKQIESLTMLVSDKFNLNAYESGVMFIFCNRKKNSIKVLGYDGNGFVLAQKKLLSKDEGKFKWPKDSEKATDTFITPEIPASLIPRSIASASLVAQIIYDKFYVGCPFYRQEPKMYDLGMSLPRNAMASWCIYVNDTYLKN